MKRAKAMAAIMAATAVVSLGALPVQAADANNSQVQAIQAEVAADPQIQSEVMAVAEEETTVAKAFNWGGLTTIGQTAGLNAAAYKVDLSETSMANNSLASGSTVKLTDQGYEFTIMTKSYSYLGQSAKPKSATVTYHEVTVKDDETGEITRSTEVTKACTVLQDENKITFTLPTNAAGLEGTTNGIPDNYQNMIKVQMTTTLKDSWLGGLFPDAMTAPTFFYLFNVAS